MDETSQLFPMRTSVAELKNRNALEKRFARQFAKLTAKQKRELKRLMGKPPDIANVPATFWAEAQQQTQDELTALMLMIYIAAANQHGMNPALSKQKGAVFAARQSREVSIGFLSHTQERLAAGSDIDVVLNSARVAAVAETEVTAAQAEGTTDAVEEAQSGGGTGPSISFGAPFWFTKCDPRVCSICWPFHGLPNQVWRSRISLPAHPHCRCFLSVLRVGRVAGRIRVRDCKAPEGADFTVRRRLVTEANRVLGFDN
jgi:hypothetical protein